MRALAAVFAREVRERWPVAAAGLAVGLVPLALPLLPTVARHGARSVREAAAVALFGVATLLFSVILGGSVVHRDLAERRLGFYFARPIAGWQIWAGKLGAAVVLALVASLLVMAPAVAFQEPWSFGGPIVELLGADGVVGLWLYSAVVLVLSAHAVRLALTARTAWLAIDLAALVAVAGLVVWSGRRLSEAWATDAAAGALRALSAALLVGLVAATAVQVTRGRVAEARGHRLLSIAFWSVALVAALGCAVFTRWVLASGPEDFRRLSVVEPAPAGSWCWIEGEARAGYRPSFLFDLETGRSMAAGTEGFVRMEGWVRRAFSPDGEAAAWVELEPVTGVAFSGGRAPETTLFVAELAGDSPVARSLPGRRRLPRRLAWTVGSRSLVSLGWDGAVQVNPLGPGAASPRRRLVSGDGLAKLEHLAAVEGGLLLAGWACDREREPVCARVIWWFELAGEGPAVELVRAPALELGGTTVGWRSLDVEGGVALAMPYAAVSPAPPRAHRIELASRTVETVELPASPEAPWRLALLGDGGMVLARSTAADQLAVLGRDGELLRTLTIPGAEEVVVGGEAAPGRLLVGSASERRQSRAPGAETERWTAWWVDLASGELEELGRGLLPAGHLGLGPASAGSRLLRRGPAGLVLLDPETRELRQVLGGS